MKCTLHSKCWITVNFLSLHQLPPTLRQQAICFVLALPVSFTEELKSQEKNRGETVTLSCKLSKCAAVQWKKGSEILTTGRKYEVKQKETLCELQIKNFNVEDSGDYICVCGQMKTSATVKVNGMDPSGPLLLHVFVLPLLHQGAFYQKAVLFLPPFEKK